MISVLLGIVVVICLLWAFVVVEYIEFKLFKDNRKAEGRMTKDKR